MDHSYCTHRNKYLAKDHCYFKTSKRTPAVVYQRIGYPVVSFGCDHSYTKFYTALPQPKPEPPEEEVDAFTAAMLEHVWIKEEKLTAEDLARLGGQLAAQRDKDHTYTQPERSQSGQDKATTSTGRPHSSKTSPGKSPPGGTST